MSKITTNIAGKTITISISGKFNSLLHTEFYKEFKSHPNDHLFIIDLKDCDYIDSSGLGLLTSLSHYVGGNKKAIIKNAKGMVKDVIKMMQFDKMFNLENFE